MQTYIGSRGLTTNALRLKGRVGTWGFAECVRGGLEIVRAVSEAAGSKEAAGLQDVAQQLCEQAVKEGQAIKDKGKPKSSCMFTYTSPSQMQFSVRAQF